MKEANSNDIKSLLKRRAFKNILREEIPPECNVFLGRFVVSIKSSIDGKVKYKARYVIGGQPDKLKNILVQTFSTLQPWSVRLLLAITAT